MSDFYGHRPRAYAGPRFYRLTCTRTRDGKAETTGASYGENRMAAVNEARRIFLPIGYACVLESLDDRYPANVLSSEEIKP